VTAVGRFLPHGWRDFFFQLSLWLGFGLVYQVARGIADRSTLEAIQNGVTVIDAERAINSLIEIDIQRAVVHAGDWALEAVNLTYWLAVPRARPLPPPDLLPGDAFITSN
jgi:hypothetical protein